jgi:hypothetical protein
MVETDGVLSDARDASLLVCRHQRPLDPGVREKEPKTEEVRLRE